MFILLLLAALLTTQAAPNIVFVMLDDLGHADLSYSSEEPDPLVKTPFIDQLVHSSGVKLTNYYVNPTCTPSRASLMTGRYAINSGLPFAVLPGSPIGIPADVPVIPEQIKQAGYDTRMVGKWHLGYGSWAQTPVGRGFNSHVGFLDLTIDSWTKQMHISPFNAGGIDWIKANNDGNYSHYAEPRHATDAITEEAVSMIQEHKNKQPSGAAPMFLYIAYNAPHSPLLAHPRHAMRCTHIPHLWRREYCGLVTGLDEAVRNISDAIESYLGPDTLLVVSSDNGATAWEGGMNAPLRGGKYSPFEGGVKVPAFIVDYTTNGKYLGERGRTYDGLMHISDWFPTLLSIAGLKSTQIASRLDGFDVSSSIRHNQKSPRNSILFELFSPGEKMHGNSWGVGYRKGKYKLIEGIFEDMSYYHESTMDGLNYTMTENYSWRYMLSAKIGEILFRFGSYFYGNGPFDSVRGALLIAVVHKVGILAQGKGQTFLFDIERDPTESTNLAKIYPEVVEELRKDLIPYRQNKPAQGKYWMVLPYLDVLKTFVPGDCSMNPAIKPGDCVFKHPFFDENSNEDNATYVHVIEEYTVLYLKEFSSHILDFFVWLADSAIVIYLFYLFMRSTVSS